MKKDPTALLVVVTLLCLMLLFGVYESSRRAKSGATRMTATTFQSARNFSLPTIDGKMVRLSDYKGKGILLNFWATDCVPCQIETPWLVSLQHQYGPEGLQILGIDTYDGGSQKDVTAFVKNMAIDYPILVGTDAEIDAVANSYGGIAFLPQTFVINRHGDIVGRILGLKSKSKIEEEAQLALGSSFGKDQKVISN